MQTTELKFRVCADHRHLDFAGQWPEFAFSELISFPSTECNYPECPKDAYYEVVGILIPSSVGEIKREQRMSLGTIETFEEAKKILEGAKAVDRLTYFLRTRIVPTDHREFLAKKLLRHYAGLILKQLKIDPECSMSDKDKHRILLEMGLYNEDVEK